MIQKDSCVLEAFVSPRASRSDVRYNHGVIKIRVNEAPINGRATEAACKELATKKKLAIGPAATIIDLWYKGFNINNFFLSSSFSNVGHGLFEFGN